MLSGLPTQAATAPDDPAQYSAAVGRVLELVTHGDAAGARSELQGSGLAAGLPEVERDLNAHPPDLADAEARLRAVQGVLEHPAVSSNPAHEKAEIKRIMSLPRFAGNQPSLWDRFWGWVGARVVDWLNSLHLPAGGIEIPTWIWLVAVGGLLLGAAAAVALVARFTRGSRRRRAAAAAIEPARMVRERFQEADRRAAAGDWDGAVRALAEAVATRLSGEPWWVSSPQTLRELFRALGWLEPLRPLLLAFEVVVYGRRPLDEAAYRAAEAAAAPVRAQPEPVESTAA